MGHLEGRRLEALVRLRLVVLPQYHLEPSRPQPTSARSGCCAAITALGSAFRFYNLGWGAPYYHFHIDEHFVLRPADLLRRDIREAAMSPKFFMYSPLPMYLINFVRGAYETAVASARS